MSNRFIHYLKIITIIHFSVLLGLWLVPAFRGLFRKKPEMMIPVEFLVDTRGMESEFEEVEEPDVEEPEAVVVQEEKKKPAPDIKPDVKKEDVPAKDKKPKIEKSKVRIFKNNNSKGKTTLTKEEILRLLAQGAKPSDRTTIPGEEDRCLMVIHNTLYEAWVQPSREEVGDLVVGIEIKFLMDGSIVGRKMVSSSGNDLLDSSAMQAVNIVKRIPGLSEDFLKRHGFVITVSFKVE